MRIAARVEYNGTAFFGFARQKNKLRTVQSELEHAFSQVAAEPVRVAVAGRTDAGVHAKGQIIHFDSNAKRKEREWLLGANSNLPGDISVLKVKYVPDDFHARHSAVQRFYQYLLINRESRTALYPDLAHWVYKPLDTKKMYEASRCLLGENDFSSFRAAECQSQTATRNIRHIEISQTGYTITIEIAANAFLQHMVRNIVGSLILLGEGGRDASWLQDTLLAKDRKLAGPTAPACGLYLKSVEYPPGIFCSSGFPCYNKRVNITK